MELFSPQLNPVLPQKLDNSNSESRPDDKISINDVESRMEQIVDEYLWDIKVQFFIELIQIAIFSYMFYRTLMRNSIRLQH